MYQYKHKLMIKKKLDRSQKNKNPKIIYFKMILFLKFKLIIKEIFIGTQHIN